MRILFAFFLTYFITVTTDTISAETFSITYERGRVVKRFPEKTRPVIGLALSGGGARGIAHLGVIEVLENKGIRIERIAGTSIGSIVGGLYAAGYSSEYLINKFNNIDWSEALSSSPRRRSTHIGLKEVYDWPLFELRFTGFRAKIPFSLSSGQHFTSILSWLCLSPTFQCQKDFDKLPIPFRSVATNLSTGERAVLSKGNLARAIQASSTVPLLFTPVSWEDMLLVDGGIVNHLPVNVAREMGCDFVIASAVEESMHPPRELNNLLNIADQVSSIPTRRVTQLSKSLADFAISPDTEHFSSTNFSDIPEIIEQGRKAALQAVPSLIDSLDKMTSSYRRTFIETLTVTPEEDSAFARKTLSSFIILGDSTHFASIAGGLETLWSSGRYCSIRAELDEENKTLELKLVPVPESVVLLINQNSRNGIINKTITISPEQNKHLPMQKIISKADKEIRKIQSEGFSFAHIKNIDLNQSADTLKIHVTVPHLTRIVVDKDLTLRKSVILREFELETGAPFNLGSVMTSLENLYGTNLFEWVFADIEPDGEGVGLFVHVKEKKWVVARFGLHFDETNHTKARISLSRENILGFGNRFSAVFEISERNRLIMFESRNSRIYKSLYTYNIKAYKNYRLRYQYLDHSNSEDYGDDRYGGVFSIGQHMGTLGSAMLEFKTETLWLYSGPKVELKSKKKELRSIVIRTLIDSYDRYPFPQNGLLNLIYVETTSEVLGGTDQFVKLYWGGSLYKTFARRHTVSGSFYLGSADPSIPDIEAFTLGGASSRLNCYDWESSGSHFYADFPGLAEEEKFGNRLTAGKIAYRLYIPRLFYLDLIYGIGNVWKKGQVINSRSLLQSFGVKGSFATPGGPISMGWGITSEGDERIYMSAGWEF